MIPAILLFCDPFTKRAQHGLANMLASLDASDVPGVVTDSGAAWAAAAIPPPASEPTCGADIYTCGSDVLIWAGEIFLEHSPSVRQLPKQRATSVALLHTLRRRGCEALYEFDGAFCGAWYDSSRRRWIVFNDKLGLIPVFWCAHEDRLVVSPRAAVTWQASGMPLQISTQGVTDLVRTQNMVDDHTLIEGVFWLKRANVLSWGEEGASCFRYWDFNYPPQRIHNEDEAVEGYIAALTKTMQRHAHTTAPLLLGISGGLDSRLLLAHCNKVGATPHCFTAGWPFYEDVRFGRQLARVAGAQHDLAPLDERALPGQLAEAIRDTDGLHSAGYLGPAVTARAYLAQHAGGVMLEGFFHGMIGGCTVPADEDVQGNVPAHSREWARVLLHAGGDFALINDLLLPDLARDSYRQWQASVDDAYQDALGEDPLHRAEHAMIHARRGRIDVLGTALLRRDVLVRNPASDRLMIEWHQKVSAGLRRARGVYISALRKHFPRFASVPRADGCGGLPILQNRWLREYYWQVAKLHRWYAAWRYPFTRRFGTGNRAIKAWLFEVWRNAGGLEGLRDSDARVLNWVHREQLAKLWADSNADPLKAGPLLTLATLETAVRSLEELSRNTSREGAGALARARAVRKHPRCCETIMVGAG